MKLRSGLLILPAGAVLFVGASAATGAPAAPRATPPGLRAEPPVLVTPTGDNEKPCLVARPRGGAYLAFAEREGEKTAVRFAVLRDGLRLDAPVRLSTPEMDLDLGAENGPNIAVDGTGRIYVAWVAGSWKVKGADHGAHAAAGGSGTPGAAAASGASGGSGSKAAADARTAGSGRSGSGRSGPPMRPGNLNIYLVVSTDDGKSFSAPVRVNDDPDGAEHRFPTLAIGERNTLYLAWLDKRLQGPEHPDFSRVFVTRSTDGGKTFSRNVDATAGQETGICHCCRIALTTHPKQGVVVAYRNDVHDMRDVFLARSTDSGATFTVPKPIESFRWMIPACPFNGPSLTLDGPGRLHSVWMTGGTVPGTPALGPSTGATYKVMYRRTDASGQTGAAPLFLAEGTHPRMVLGTDGTPYVVWDGGGIHLARLGAAKPALLPLVPSGRDVVFPSLTLASDGNLLVAWQRNDEDGRSQIYVSRVATGSARSTQTASR